LSLNAVAEIPLGSKHIGALRIVDQDDRKTLKSRLVRFIQPMLRDFGTLFGPFLPMLKATSQLSPYSQTAIITHIISHIISSIPGPLSHSRYVNLLEKTTGNLGFRELDKKGRILRAQKKAFTERILMALFGGAALIGPMLIMTLHRSLNTSLITVSVATFFFALVLALYTTNSEGKDCQGTLVVDGPTT
jgi:hypothetical protein